MMLCTPLGAQAKRVALLIGNADYVSERDLRNPVNDAELLGRVLREDLKFDLVRVERNLTLARMDALVEQFAQQAKGASSVVFYFSGHGLTSPAERRSFLLPVDARTGTPDALPLRRQAVAADEVRDALRAAGAKVTLMLLDACRDGPGGGKSGSKGLARVGGGEQFLVAYATEEGQIAEDGSGRNSPYAQALAEAWRQPLPILSQLDKVYDLVTAQVPGQRPTREGNLRADARLSPLAPAAAQALPLANREAAMSGVSAEDRAWAECLAATTPTACEAYVRAHPQGRHIALARQQLRLLAQTQPAASIVQPSAPVSTPAAAPTAPPLEKLTFAADLWFSLRGTAVGTPGNALLAELVGKVNSMTLEVIIAVGHASPDEGNADQTQRLSVQRAESVKAQLVALGIDANRVYTEGKGVSNPVADNATAEGRAKNRRVELEALGTRPRR